MTAETGPAPVDGDDLGPAGEAEWQRLHRQLELGDGFWLGFLFSPSPRSVAILRRRLENHLRHKAEKLRLLQVDRPEDLLPSLTKLFEPESAAAGCVWVEAIHVDSKAADGEAGPWTQAWDQLFLRTNEKRDALRGFLKGGLVFVAPLGVKPRLREAAPDLWSVRSIVLELPAVPTPIRENREEDRTASREPFIEAALAETLPDPDFALAEAARRRESGAEDPRPVVSALLRAVPGLLAQERVPEALDAANEARSLLEKAALTDKHEYAEALAALSEVEEAHGDLAAATDHVNRALALRRGAYRRAHLEWFDRAGRLAGARGDLADAAAIYGESVSMARGLLQEIGPSSEGQRDLSVHLERLGDVRMEAGDLAAAASCFEESLSLSRHILQAFGNSHQALRDLSVSLNKLADVRKEAGDLASAASAFEESLVLGRRILHAFGERPVWLRDLTLTLQRLAAIRRETGDEEAARALGAERDSVKDRLRRLTPEQVIASTSVGSASGR